MEEAESWMPPYILSSEAADNTKRMRRRRRGEGEGQPSSMVNYLVMIDVSMAVEGRKIEKDGACGL